MRLGIVLAVLVAATAASAARTVARPLAQVNVSKAAGAQAEVAIAIDPTNDDVLLAGSNSLSVSRSGAGGADTHAPGRLRRAYAAENSAAFARVYGSTDGGATWTSEPGPFAAPVAGKRRCNYGDPAVAIDRSARQYYVFLAAPCLADIAELFEEGEALPVSLQVASRSGPGRTWNTVSVFPTRLPRTDDKPAIGVDSSPASPYLNRVYVTWTRIKVGRFRPTDEPLTEILLSRSDDGGATWSKPVLVSDRTSEGSVFASVATGRNGDVYVSWVDGARNIWVDRSVDGGRRFGADTHVDTAPGLPEERCAREGLSIPAQRKRCITSVPLVTIDDREGFSARVYVTYGAPSTPGFPQDVFVAAFDSELRAILGAPAGVRQQVNPPDGAVGSDQFLPAAAVDASNGRLWVCFYDTTGDRRRERVFYTCTLSADGGATWSRPIRAANVPSNVTVRRASSFQFGEYAGLAVANGIAHPIWTDTRNLAARAEEIYTTVLTQAQLEAP